MFKALIFVVVTLAPVIFAHGVDDDTKWKSYCDSRGNITRISPKTPNPNYSNALIKSAASKLNQIVGSSFSLYSDMKEVYSGNEAPPSWVNSNSHRFLTILCGEFRDDVTLFERKLKLFANIHIVPKGAQQYDSSKGVWEQITGEGYDNLVALSHDIYDKKQNSGRRESVEAKKDAVPAMTKCEYRYLLKEYLAKGMNNLEQITQKLGYLMDSYTLMGLASAPEFLKGAMSCLERNILANNDNSQMQTCLEGLDVNLLNDETKESWQQYLKQELVQEYGRTRNAAQNNLDVFKEVYACLANVDYANEKSAYKAHFECNTKFSYYKIADLNLIHSKLSRFHLDKGQAASNSVYDCIMAEAFASVSPSQASLKTCFDTHEFVVDEWGLKKLFESSELLKSNKGGEALAKEVVQCMKDVKVAQITNEDRWLASERYESATRECNLIAENTPFAIYKKGFQTFKGQCSSEEKAYYNEFRGDGNAKPHTLESNGMIWNGRVFSKFCASPYKAKQYSLMTDKECQDYFSQPYSTRSKKTWEGMYRILFYPPEFDRQMEGNDSVVVFVTEDLDGDGVGELVVTSSSEDGSKESPFAEARALVNNLRREKNWQKAGSVTDIMQYVVTKAFKEHLGQNSSVDLDAVLEKLDYNAKRAVKSLNEPLAVEDFINLGAVTLAKVKESTSKWDYEDLATEGVSEQEFNDFVGSIFAAMKNVMEEWKDAVDLANLANDPARELETKLIDQLNAELTQKNYSEAAKKRIVGFLPYSFTGEIQDGLYRLAGVNGRQKEFSQVVGMYDGTVEPGITTVTAVHEDWNQNYVELKDLGFEKIFDTPEKAWDRIATALDRHTSWYHIDMLVIGKGHYQPTYSPWVASSYYIHNSDAFTIPGYAMGLPGDGHKHWMFVQRVKTENWHQGKDFWSKWGQGNFDLRNLWFDEVTISRSSLGQSENGWDRPLAPDVDEIDSVFWLYNAFDQIDGNDH